MPTCGPLFAVLPWNEDGVLIAAMRSNKMTEHHIAAIPVVYEGGYLKGLVTISESVLRQVQDAERTLDSDQAIYDQGFMPI